MRCSRCGAQIEQEQAEALSDVIICPIHHYPSCNGRIQVAHDRTHVLADLRNRLNKYKDEVDKFNKMSKAQQLRYMKHNKSIPQFGTNPEKEEMMMGVLYVKFTNGTELKITTVSGDETFSVRSSVPEINDLTYTPNPEPLAYEYSGFRFIDPGKPKGNAYDVYNKRETNTPYNKSCAAQKLMYILAQHMKENPQLKIQGDIYMAESWYKPGTGKYSANQVGTKKSCQYCERVLPAATGSNSTGSWFW